MIRKTLAVAVAVAIILPGTANAKAPTLSKTAAHTRAVSFTRMVYTYTGEAVGYRVSPARDCLRWSARRVSCAYAIDLEDGSVCTNTVVVTRKTSGRLAVTTPYDPSLHVLLIRPEEIRRPSRWARSLPGSCRD